MRCLSLCQPYADLVVYGRKGIKLRRWGTKYRGEFLVHASLRVGRDDCDRLGTTRKPVIGRAEILGVKEYRTTDELNADEGLHRAGFCELLDGRGAVRVPAGQRR